MKVIKSIIFDNKEAKLVLLKDNILQVFYDDMVVSTHKGYTWNNIKNEPELQLVLLQLEVEVYVKKKQVEEELDMLVKKYL